jgi:hypothetical protein
VALTHFRSALNALELDLFPEAYGTFKKAHERAIGALEIFHILGAWDGDVEKGIISYKAPIARALIGHKLGEVIEMPTDKGELNAEIISIEAWNKGGN